MRIDFEGRWHFFGAAYGVDYRSLTVEEIQGKKRVASRHP